MFAHLLLVWKEWLLVSWEAFEPAEKVNINRDVNGLQNELNNSSRIQCCSMLRDYRIKVFTLLAQTIYLTYTEPGWVYVNDKLVILKKILHFSVNALTFCNVMLTFSRLTHLSVPSMSRHFRVSWKTRQLQTFRAASATTLRYKYQHVCRRI